MKRYLGYAATAAALAWTFLAAASVYTGDKPLLLIVALGAMWFAASEFHSRMGRMLENPRTATAVAVGIANDMFFWLVLCAVPALFVGLTRGWFG